MRRKKFAWASLPDEQLLKLRLKDLKVTVEGTWLEDCLDDLHEELAAAGHPGAAACLDLERVVQPGQHARHRVPVLSGASAPDAAREERRSSTSKAAPGRSACAFSATKPATWCSTPISCSAGGAGSSCSARHRNAIRAITGRIRPAGITSSICGCGMRRAIRTRISPRRSRSGCGRARTGARATPVGRR